MKFPAFSLLAGKIPRVSESCALPPGQPSHAAAPRRTRRKPPRAPTTSVGAGDAAAIAGSSRTRVYELRKTDPDFASAWQDAEDIAAERLEDEARRRALEGVPEPLVSAGKLVRVDNGQPITIQRYSDNLLLALRSESGLRVSRPRQR